MSLSRLQADALLLFIAMIWGTAFVAQKEAAMLLPFCTFVSLRFLISAIVVAPLALHERKRHGVAHPLDTKALCVLSAVFTGAVLLQQAGMKYTSVTHASFLTSLYVLAVPFLGALIYKSQISQRVFVAAALSCLGVFFLSGGMETEAALNVGDILILLCAIGFALHVLLLDRIMRLPRPFSVCFFQYLFLAIAAGLFALIFEAPLQADIASAAWPLFYLGVISGAGAYTLQAVAQRHTPPADAAIILGSEALFGALSGIWLLGEVLTGWMWVGSLLILASILIVEAWPMIRMKIRRSPTF